MHFRFGVVGCCWLFNSTEEEVERKIAAIIYSFMTMIMISALLALQPGHTTNSYEWWTKCSASDNAQSMSYTQCYTQMTEKTTTTRTNERMRIVWTVESLDENETRNQIKNTFNVIILWIYQWMRCMIMLDGSRELRPLI